MLVSFVSVTVTANRHSATAMGCSLCRQRAEIGCPGSVCSLRRASHPDSSAEQEEGNTDSPGGKCCEASEPESAVFRMISH